MANRIKGLTIEIGGDTTKLDKALSGTNKEIKQTQSELKDVERLLKLDPKNTELLAQKQKLLAQGVEQTSKKLEELKKAEQQLKASGVDENSQQFMALRREIIDTEQQMKGFKTSAKDASKGVKEVTDQTKAVEGLKNAAATAAKAFAAMAAAAGGIVIGTTKALADATKAAAEFADEIITQSQITGIATDKLQEYAYAAELVDVSVDTLTGAIARTIRSMNAARNGTKTYTDAFKQLGVKIKDSKGNLRDSEDVFWDIVEALGKMKNETDRDAVAMTLLGRSAQDLNPLIKAGKDRLSELADEAHRLGFVMDNETLAAFAAYDDNLQKLERTGEALKRSFGSVLLPVLQSVSEKGVNFLGELAEKIQNADGDVGKIADAFKDVLPRAFKAFSGDIKAVLKVVTDIVKAIADVITQPDVMDGIIEIFNELISSISDSIKKLMPAIKSLIEAILKELPTVINELLPSIVDVLLALVNDVILSPEVMEAIVFAAAQIAQKVVERLQNPDALINGTNPINPETWGNPQPTSYKPTEEDLAILERYRKANGGNTTTNDATTNITATVNFNGDLASVGRALQPSISLEDARRGISLTNVRSYAR